MTTTAEERRNWEAVFCAPGRVRVTLNADVLRRLIDDVEQLKAELVESVKHHAVATENNINLGNENKRLEAERDKLRKANGEVGLMWAETEEAKNKAEAQLDEKEKVG